MGRPEPRGLYDPADERLLWDVVRTVLDQGECAGAAPGATEQARLTEAMALLYVDPAAVPRVPSEAALVYARYRDAVIVAEQHLVARAGSAATGIALARFAHRRTAVTDAIDHDMDFARLGAVHDDRLPPDVSGDEIAGFGNIADVRDPDPGAVEDAVHLLLEDLRIAIERGVDAVVKDQGVEITCSHFSSPLLARSGTGMSAVSFQ